MSRYTARRPRRLPRPWRAASRLPSCGRYVDTYLADYARRNRPSSLHTQSARLRRFREDFKRRSLDLDRAELKQWVYGEGPWSDRGPIPKWEVTAITSLYNHAIDTDDLPLHRNPARGLRPPPRAPEAPPTPAEFEALLSACSTLGDYAETMRAALLVGACSLLRPSELYALRWTDIDFARRRIRTRPDLADPRVPRRLIGLTPAASEALRRVPRRPGPVFRSKTGHPLTAPTFAGYWQAVLATAELRFRLHHALKHHGVHYLWSELGLSPRAIAAQAGWKLETANRLLAAQGYGETTALHAVDAAFRPAPRAAH